MSSKELKALLADHDWQEAFGCVGEPGKNNSGVAGVTKPCEGKIEPRAVPMSSVISVIAAADGENDGLEWVGVFKLRGGLYLTLRAGCDYTGWDCQSGGSGELSKTLSQAVQWGLSDDERSRLADQLDKRRVRR